MCNWKIADLHDLNILSRFIINYPGLNRTPDRNPGSDSDTISLERDRDRTLHESNPRYVVSDSGMSSLTPRECRVRVGRNIETDLTCTSSHPASRQVLTLLLDM